MDPSMAGFLADERVHNRDLNALIPYWGSQGLISMQEGELKGSGKRKIKKAKRANLMGGVIFLMIFLIIFWSGGTALYEVTSQNIGSVFGLVIQFLVFAFPLIFVTLIWLYK